MCGDGRSSELRACGTLGTGSTGSGGGVPPKAGQSAWWSHQSQSRLGLGRQSPFSVAREMADQIAAAPAVTVKMAREVIRHLAQPQLRSSMAYEVIYQTFINRSDDMAEMRAARAEDRPPRYTGS